LLFKELVGKQTAPWSYSNRNKDKKQINPSQELPPDVVRKVLEFEDVVCRSCDTQTGPHSLRNKSATSRRSSIMPVNPSPPRSAETANIVRVLSSTPTIFDRRRTLSQRCLSNDRRSRCSDTDVFTEDKVKLVLPGDFKRPLVKTISENR